MDYNSPIETENKSVFDSFELQLTLQAQSFLRETGRWAMFLAIVGFISIGLWILLGIFYIAMAGNMFPQQGMPASMSMIFPAMGGIIIVSSLLFIFPTVYLLKFASKTKEALADKNTEKLTEAFENHKSFYKFIGIFTIIVISFYILFFIFAIIGGIAGAASM